MNLNRNWKKDIILFLAGQTISVFGSSLVQYAMMWSITINTDSGLMMTIYIICGLLPTLFLSPFAGVWADRYDRKKIIILADSFIAIATLILAILFFMGYNSIWLIFIMAAIRAFGSGVHTPAIGAILPQMVPQEELTRVNAINNTVQSSVFLIAPMLSAGLMKLVDIQYILLVDVVTAALAVLILLFLVDIPSHSKALEAEEVHFLDDMKKGFTYIKGHGYLKQFFLFSMIFFFLISPLAFLTPLQITRSYEDDVWNLSALEIAWSSGMILGGAIMASWGGFKNKVHTMAFSTVVTGIGTIILGLNPLFWIYLACMGIMGVTMPMFGTPSTVILQQKTDPDYLGRIFSVYSMIHSSMMPLGMLLFGPLADIIKIESILLPTGVLITIMSLYLIRSKVMLEAGKD